MFLGPTTNPSTITGLMTSQLTTFFNLINSALDPMLTAWTYLNTTQGQSNISSLLTAEAADMASVAGIIDGNITNLATRFSVFHLTNVAHRPNEQNKGEFECPLWSHLIAIHHIVYLRSRNDMLVDSSVTLSYLRDLRLSYFTWVGLVRCADYGCSPHTGGLPVVQLSGCTTRIACHCPAAI
jgi:hypothetical protein